MLKKGDKVVMHTCGEAEYYYGQIWTCQYDQFTATNGSPVVFLEGFSGYFSVEYLQFVDLKTNQIKVKEEPVIINIPHVDSWTKTDLLYTCKKNKVKGYTKMDKPQLIEAVKKIIADMKGEE